MKVQPSADVRQSIVRSKRTLPYVFHFSYTLSYTKVRHYAFPFAYKWNSKIFKPRNLIM